MIEIEPLASGRYLLGFSGGVDSSALFFLLLESKVDFDIAIVDYGVREQSKEEVEYAKSLAKKYGKECFHTLAPSFDSNFEAQARGFRYGFFSSIIKERGYCGLLLAHQLDDRFEWMMMQLCKGAGLNTLLGFDFAEERRGYTVYRPLWKVPKEQIYEYCKSKGVRYFEDSSNKVEQYKRNVFRERLKPFMNEYREGIKKSLEYLREERRRLYPSKKIKEFVGVIFWDRGDEGEDMHILDLEFKKKGYILSAKQKQEIIRCRFSCEIVDFVVESTSSRLFFFRKKEGKMSKKFKDFARAVKIPKRLRSYLFWCGKTKEEILSFLGSEILLD